MAHVEERNQDATVWCGDLEKQVDEALLWELFLQCGPVVNVHIPRDKLTKEHSTYGFVEFRTEQDAEYAIKIMNMVRLYGKPMKCNKVWGSRDKKTNDVGANLFIGSLDLDADEHTLQAVFGSFGQLISPPKIMRDEQNRSKGFGFVSYDSFESADAAIAAMHGQWLMNKQINVQYALKKDSKNERHGSMAERLLAANNPARKLPPPPGTAPMGFGAPPPYGGMPMVMPPMAAGGYSPMAAGGYSPMGMAPPPMGGMPPMGPPMGIPGGFSGGYPPRPY